MYKNILVATDGLDIANKAVEQGLTLAKALGARCTVLLVSEPWTTSVSGELAIGFPVAEYDKAMDDRAKLVLSRVDETAKTMGVACQTLHAKDQMVADGIVATAKANACDLIVMGSHGRRGLQKFLLGSQATKVVVLSPVPVLIVR
jgi:nucleotide-binding universal stress UspA family protein